MASASEPRRGEVWLTAFGAARPGELGKHRPAIVVSVDRVLAGSPVEPIVVVPLSSSVPPSQLRPEIHFAAGLDRPSSAICGALRGVARSRLLERLGTLAPETLAEVERALILILGLRGA
ncbi:MAG TPA: type II toxin-antitoxin system PemK/MazF family toxin [Solirubrobacteraceae bacterium]|nr:type II toxin-antitoxin system PemK/MazF family toxin [Solirubrobacteraceae bacterium]